MSKIDPGLREDKALRDAALRLVKSDLALLKGDYKARGPVARLKDRVTEGSVDLAEKSVAYAGSNPVKTTGAFLAVLALVFARRPIWHALGDLLHKIGLVAEPPSETNHSVNELEKNGDSE